MYISFTRDCNIFLMWEQESVLVKCSISLFWCYDLVM